MKAVKDADFIALAKSLKEADVAVVFALKNGDGVTWGLEGSLQEILAALNSIISVVAERSNLTTSEVIGLIKDGDDGYNRFCEAMAGKSEEEKDKAINNLIKEILS